jgi:hypothetical protein
VKEAVIVSVLLSVKETVIVVVYGFGFGLLQDTAGIHGIQLEYMYFQPWNTAGIHVFPALVTDPVGGYDFDPKNYVWSHLWCHGRT